jgi:hypothetical protein
MPAVAHQIVGRQELLVVADVEPPAVETIPVDGSPLVEPCDEVARLIGGVALGEVLLEERHVLAMVDVRRRADQGGRRVLRLLDERDDPFVLVELDDAVLLDELHVVALVERERAGLALPCPVANVIGQAEIEEVVAGDDQEVLSVELAVFHGEANVTDGAEAVGVGERAVVVYANRHLAGVLSRPFLEAAGELVVGHHVNGVDFGHLDDLVVDVVDHRAPGERQ